MNAVQTAWFRQSRTEYMAASLVAEVTHWMHLLGVNPDLLVRATRVVSDEVRHATICRELYVHVGGDDTPIQIEPKRLSHRDDPGAPIPLRTITAAGQLACEESVAVAVFRLRVRNATDPMAREVCEVILREESTHRGFAFAVLDDLMRILGDDTVREWVRPRLPWWLRTYLLAELTENEPVYPPEDLAFGLVDRREHWAAMRDTVVSDVLPMFHRRGLLEEDAGLDELHAELVAMNGRPPGRG